MPSPESGARGIALAGSHPQAHLTHGAGGVQGLGLTFGDRNGAHGPENIGIKANEALARAIAAHGELIGLGIEVVRPEFNAIFVDANNLKDGVGIGIVHRDAGLGAQGRLGEPNRYGQQGGKGEHGKEEGNTEQGRRRRLLKAKILSKAGRRLDSKQIANRLSGCLSQSAIVNYERQRACNSILSKR